MHTCIHTYIHAYMFTDAPLCTVFSVVAHNVRIIWQGRVRVTVRVRTRVRTRVRVMV